MKVLIFVVAYNAEAHIERVLNRIPKTMWSAAEHDVTVLIIDDQSKDQTTEVSHRFRTTHPHCKLIVLSNPVNQGYGGNQKLGYYYAIENDYDLVVLLHGDGQYAPEMLPDFVAAFQDPAVAAVFGSRMLSPRAALKGGMPLYKFVGNRILTTIQNRLLKQTLSEFHSGYRAYRVDALRRLPFAFNSPDFDFDTDIIIQLVDVGAKIVEIPIPTYYGNEICHVNGIKYAGQILWSTLRSRLQRYGIVYHPKFDYETDNQHYSLKLNQPSSHQWALDACKGKATVLDLGCGPGALGVLVRQQGSFYMGVDQYPSPAPVLDWFEQANLDAGVPDLTHLPRAPEVVLCLDIIEHLRSPEQFLLSLRERLSNLTSELPPVIISTPNVAFGMTRLGLLLGRFSYGKRGILDLTHTRLFTFPTLEQTLSSAGYEVLDMRGVPPPLQMVFGSGVAGRVLTMLHSGLVKLWRNFFSYQIFATVRPLPTLGRLLGAAHAHAEARANAVLPLG